MKYEKPERFRDFCTAKKNVSVGLACMAQKKGGGGREKRAKVGKREAAVSPFVTYKYSRLSSVVAARDVQQAFLAGRARRGKGR